MITLLLLVRATYMYGVVLHAHPVRGGSHNQRNTTGEVATIPWLTVHDDVINITPVRTKGAAFSAGAGGRRLLLRYWCWVLLTPSQER